MVIFNHYNWHSLNSYFKHFIFTYFENTGQVLRCERPEFRSHTLGKLSVMIMSQLSYCGDNTSLIELLGD